MKNQDKNKKHDLTDTSKSDKKDIGNSLERDVTSSKQTGKTPQARTDNEQDREVKKRKS
ncbi:hypothetical protein [Pontibacter flavimaris]|uniref:hypothetical protein n=1 Tax=Pontibacter flavimaris TaxID=1797110 RepID=UPI00147DAAC4|nr:hypothetical protein [Pontibacter flavimaris]